MLWPYLLKKQHNKLQVLVWLLSLIVGPLIMKLSNCDFLFVTILFLTAETVTGLSGQHVKNNKDDAESYGDSSSLPLLKKPNISLVTCFISERKSS